MDAQKENWIDVFNLQYVLVRVYGGEKSPSNVYVHRYRIEGGGVLGL